MLQCVRVNCPHRIDLEDNRLNESTHVLEGACARALVVNNCFFEWRWNILDTELRQYAVEFTRFDLVSDKKTRRFVSQPESAVGGLEIMLNCQCVRSRKPVGLPHPS